MFHNKWSVTDEYVDEFLEKCRTEVDVKILRSAAERHRAIGTFIFAAKCYIEAANRSYNAEDWRQAAIYYLYAAERHLKAAQKHLKLFKKYLRQAGYCFENIGRIANIEYLRLAGECFEMSDMPWLARQPYQTLIIIRGSREDRLHVAQYFERIGNFSRAEYFYCHVAANYTDQTSWRRAANCCKKAKAYCIGGQHECNLNRKIALYYEKAARISKSLDDWDNAAYYYRESKCWKQLAYCLKTIAKKTNSRQDWLNAAKQYEQNGQLDQARDCWLQVKPLINMQHVRFFHKRPASEYPENLERPHKRPALAKEASPQSPSSMLC